MKCKLFFPVCAILMTVLVTACSDNRSGWSGYHLTDEGDVMRYSCKKSEHISGNNTITLDGCAIPLRKVKDSLYMQQRFISDGKCMFRGLVNFDTKKGTHRSILELEEGWYLGTGWIGSNGCLIDDTYYNILRNADKKQYRLLILPYGSRCKQIPFYGNFYEEKIESLEHVGGNPLQFFISTESKLFRVFENGESEELDFSFSSITAWKNRILVFTANDMTLYEIGAKLTPVFHLEKKKIRMIRRKRSNRVCKKVLYRVAKDFFVMDLQNPVPVKIDIRSVPYYYNTSAVSPEVLDILWVKGEELTYGRLNEGVIKNKKKWRIDLKKRRWRRIDPSPRGVMVYNGEEYRSFLFDI